MMVGEVLEEALCDGGELCGERGSPLEEIWNGRGGVAGDNINFEEVADGWDDAVAVEGALGLSVMKIKERVGDGGVEIVDGIS